MLICFVLLEGVPTLLRCTLLLPSTSTSTSTPAVKPKGNIQWVALSSAVDVQVRVYNHLFTVEEPSDANWEQELNPESEVVLMHAKVCCCCCCLFVCDVYVCMKTMCM